MGDFAPLPQREGKKGTERKREKERVCSGRKFCFLFFKVKEEVQKFTSFRFQKVMKTAGFPVPEESA